MSWVTLVAIYFVVWWVCLFVVLPFGVRTQAEEGDTILGTTESAPFRPMLVRKALITTALAGVIVGAIWVAHDRYGIDLDYLSSLFS